MAAAGYLPLIHLLSFGRGAHRKYIQPVSKAAQAIGLVLGATAIAYELHLNLASAGFLQLLAILAIALRAGFVQATVASVVANCCLNYLFVPPLFSLAIGDPQNWVALIVFEFSALVVSRLSTEAQAQAARAISRESNLERLYQVSQSLLLLSPDKPPGPQILSLINRVFSINAAVLFEAPEATVESIGSESAELEAHTRAAYLQNRDFQTPDGQTWIRNLRLGSRSMGALALKSDGMPAVTANALASLTAIALERARSVQRQSRAEAERQTEQLRTVVLDSLAHDYKTPLTVIRTATSCLLEMGQLTENQAELVGLIDSEIMRLNDLTIRLLQTSRLDRDDLQLRSENIDVNRLIQAVLANLQQLLSTHAVQVQESPSPVFVRADRGLVEKALTQFLDNAAKYSAPGSAIQVAVVVLPEEVRISVHNRGAYIAPGDLEHIFQRFYRTPDASSRTTGTGLGLSISRKVAHLHDGRAWATSDRNTGNTFWLALPRAQGNRT